MYPKFEIVNINELVPLEYVFKHHLENLESMIKDVIYKPLIADINSGTILDGSHRYAYFYKHGYITVPVLWVDYMDSRISTGITLDKVQILNRNSLLPPRTTRHTFFFLKEDIVTSLDTLKKKKNNRKIDHLLWNSTKKEELQHNLGYLKELKESETYIRKQLNMMKEKAYFPGKFNPPHMGHAATILKLKEEYDLEVVVTGDIPENSKLSQDEIVSELQNLSVNVSKLDGKLIDLDKSPFNGIILTGNEEVIKWCEKTRTSYKYIDRSGKLEAKWFRNGEF